MSTIALAAIQMRLGTIDNTAAMCDRLDLAMASFPWLEMVIFSELAAYGSGRHHAQPLPGHAEELFRRAAQKHGVWLIPGSLYELRADGAICNTSPVIAPDGTVVLRYRKMFPFLPYEQGVTPGDVFEVFDVPDVGRFGISICYDMWFPETTRTLVAMGAEVILHPSLTPTIDRDAELAIARASAVINQCFVVDVNGLEAGGNGRSIIVGPNGNVVHQAGDAPQIIPVVLDLERVRRVREQGLQGLGQPLKSFRDRAVQFAVYDPARQAEFPYLHQLGTLSKPARRATNQPPPVATELPNLAHNVPSTGEEFQ